MYSKDRGITRRESPSSLGGRSPFGDRQPAYRQSRPERVQVPPNYSGHAIVDGEERPLGSLTPHESEPSLPVSDTPTPRFDDLPRVSELGDPHRRQPRALPASFEVREEPVADRPADGEGATRAVPETPPPPSPPSAERTERGPSLLHSVGLSLTQGFGLEELLLLGLILFLLRENGDGCDRGDLDETVILLGLLLLLG